MKKHLAIGFGATLAVLVTIIGILELWKSEPVYKGRRVTDWIRDSNLFIPRSHAAAQRIQAQRIETRRALRAIGSKTVPYLVDDLQYKDSLCKRAWLPLRQSLPQRIKRAAAGWTVPDWSVRANAANILGDLRHSSQPAVPYLVQALEDPIPAVQSAAMETLARIGANPDQLATALQARLKEPTTRWQTLRDRVGFSAGGELTAQTLVDVFSASNRADPQQILYLLERIGPQAKLAMPTLIRALSSTDKETRYLAAGALAAIGPGAQAAVLALSARLSDVNTMVADAAARALKLIDPETNVSPPANP